MADRQRWNEVQLRFLEGHAFHTPSSSKLRNNGLQKNILFVKRRLGLS